VGAFSEKTLRNNVICAVRNGNDDCHAEQRHCGRRGLTMTKYQRKS
jgi:hypothetical protein